VRSPGIIDVLLFVKEYESQTVHFHLTVVIREIWYQKTLIYPIVDASYSISLSVLVSVSYENQRNCLAS